MIDYVTKEVYKQAQKLFNDLKNYMVNISKRQTIKIFMILQTRVTIMGIQ